MINLKRACAAGLVLVMIAGFSGCGLKTAGGYYKEAIQYFEQKNYVKAQESFENAIERNPERAEFYVDYGLMKIQTGDCEGAIETLNKAILDKDVKMVQENNKKAYRGIGIAYYNMLEYEKALEQFNKALEISGAPEINADILAYKGSICEKMGLWKDAVSAYDEIIRTSTVSADIYTARAYAYLNVGGIQMSRDDYDRALGLDPNNFNIYLGKYALMKQTNDEIGAAAVLKQAAALPVETADDRFQYAKVKYYLKDAEAESLLTASAAEGSTLSYFYLGEIAREKGDYAGALENYRAYLDNNNFVNSALYNQMAVCSMEVGDYDEALGYIEKGMLVSTPDQEKTLRHNEVAVYEKRQDYEGAYKKAAEFLEDYPDDERMKREFEFLKTRVPEEKRISPGQ